MPIFVNPQVRSTSKDKPPEKNGTESVVVTLLDLLFTVTWIIVGLWLTSGVRERLQSLSTDLFWWKWHWSLPLVFLATIALSLLGNLKDGTAGKQPLYPKGKMPFFMLLLFFNALWIGLNEELITRWINLHLVVAGWQWLFGSANILAAHFVVNAWFGLLHYLFPPAGKSQDWGYAMKAYFIGWGCYLVLINYGLAAAILVHALFDLTAFLLSAYRFERNRSR